MSSTRQLWSRGWVNSLIPTAVLLAVVSLLALNIQPILDTVNYYQYQPGDRIAKFVSDTGMNDTGKFLFYASHPSIKGSDTFSALCGASEAKTAILGCYNGQNIYIYDVTDARLAGVRATVAAHEMLHAAYKRLSENERQSVDRLLEAEYAALKTDKSFSDRMAFYARIEPGERENELHSLIGTEVRQITPELEKHYSRYFKDRGKVVSLYEQYRSVFEELQARSESLKVAIEQLRTRINDDTVRYNNEVAAMQRDVNAFNTRANRGDFNSQSQFTLERQQLVARGSGLDALRASIVNDIATYYQLVDELNGIAIETNELNRSLDSSLAQPPSV